MTNMGHIQTNTVTYVSLTPAQNVLSAVELTTHLKQDREKWHAIFQTCITLFPSNPDCSKMWLSLNICLVNVNKSGGFCQVFHIHIKQTRK